MPLELSWSVAWHLIADGFLIGVGWIVAGAVYAALLGVLSRGKAA